MTYPKPVMSITDMTKLGFSKTDLYKMAKHPLADKYIIRTGAGGKIYYDTEKFEQYRRLITTPDNIDPLLGAIPWEAPGTAKK